MIPYGKQSVETEEIEAVIEVLKSDFLTTGPIIEAFEKQVASYCGTTYAVAVSNGTAALHIASMALGLGRGDEGITSPNTFLASSNCLAYCQAIPRFADIDEKTFCIDMSEIKKQINSKTRVIIPVHFAGQPCDMESIHLLAQQEGLFVIEDAAHALGSKWKDINGNWHQVGSCRHSDLTIFSFHPVKTITTGEGGMILTNDENLAHQCRLLRNHGIERDPLNFQGISFQSFFKGKEYQSPWYYEMHQLGFNYRLTDIQAALGIVQMDRLNAFVGKRRKIWQRYNEELKDIEEFITPFEREDVHSAWHLYTSRVVKRNDLLDYLRKNRIGAHAMYIPVHLQPWYGKEYGYKRGDFPTSEKYFDTCLVLPLYPTLTEDEQTYIIQKIKEFFNK